MTVSPGATYTNDILGNRLTKGSASYGWDCLNRMVSYMNGSANETYGYRADGMRTFKSNSGSTTVYRYDGQMGMEDVDIAGSTTDVTDYGLGARGIDYISYSVNGGTPSVSFPVYDAHGNMVATLARSGGGTYQVSNQRAYGAWGEIRQGATTGDPKGRYCANLGHKQDDESGLTYMRARYYDGLSGRFVSQDSEGDKSNWYVYVENTPTMESDESGNYATVINDFAGILLSLAGLKAICKESNLALPMIISALVFFAAWMNCEQIQGKNPFLGGEKARDKFFINSALFSSTATGLVAKLMDNKPKSLVGEIVGVASAYALVLSTFMFVCDLEEATQ